MSEPCRRCGTPLDLLLEPTSQVVTFIGERNWQVTWEPDAIPQWLEKDTVWFDNNVRQAFRFHTSKRCRMAREARVTSTNGDR